MTIRLIHVHQLETFYLCYGGQMSILGHWGPKVVFHYKCYNLSMLHSLAIRLIRVHQLVTLFLFHGAKCQSGVIWGHWGRKVIFAKNALTRPWYIAWPYDSYMSISLRPSIFVSGSNVNLGSTRGSPRQGTPSVTATNSSSFFLLSFFLATRLFHILLYILFRPNLVKETSTLTTTQAQTMMGSKVTGGFTGVKKVIFTKMHQVLQNAYHWRVTYAYA